METVCEYCSCYNGAHSPNCPHGFDAMVKEAVAAERERCADEIERLRVALRVIGDDPEAGVNIALYVKAALAGG